MGHFLCRIVHLFVSSTNVYLLSANYMPGTVVGPGGKTGERNILCLCVAYTL